MTQLHEAFSKEKAGWDFCERVFRTHCLKNKRSFLHNQQVTRLQCRQITMLYAFPKNQQYNEENRGQRRRMSFASNKMFSTITVIALLVLINTMWKMKKDNMHIFQRSLCSSGTLTSQLKFGRRLLCEVDTLLQTDSFRDSFPEANISTTYNTADYDTDMPGGSDNVAFVLTITSCPEDASSTTADDDDPGYAFYDAVAVLRDSVCNCSARNPASESKYTSTLYAIIHPDALNCDGPTNSLDDSSGDQSAYKYDRVKVLQELGFWVLIWREPVDHSEIPDSNTYLKSQIQTETGILRDLMRLYAYNLTNHPVAVMMNFDTVFLNPVDAIVDDLILNNESKRSIHVKKENGMVNAGALFVITSEAELLGITESFKNTLYNSVTGWGGTGHTGLGAEGILSYYYSENPIANTEGSAIEDSVISFASKTTCGKPWACHYNDTWDNETVSECRALHSAWYHYRKNFEDNWSKTEVVNTTQNNFHNDFFLGYCTASGEEGYERASDHSYESPNTEWSLISPSLLDSTMSPLLPSIPSLEQASGFYGEDFNLANGAPFATYDISNFPVEAKLCDESNFTSARAGPANTCTADTCSGPGMTVGSTHCRAVVNSNSIQLLGKLGTYWAKALASPAWMQFTFPAVPPGSSEFRFSYKLDHRYRPELYGGNACANATDSYNCTLCTEPSWDYSVDAGVYVLWTAAGRDKFIITGPYDGLGLAFDSQDYVQSIDSPSGLNLQPGEYPVVTLMTYAQYPAFGEVSDPSSCSVAESNELAYPLKDKQLMIEKASLMYRSSLTLLQEPMMARPRLYGTDTEWLSKHVTPFFDASCDTDTASGAGWFESAGYISFKNRFDLAARGFRPCDGDVQPSDISEWHSLSDYFEPQGYPNQLGGYRAFHLLRRQWACANANGGYYTTCEYNQTETNRLASAVAEREMERFAATTWTCGVTCGGSSSAAFDLTSAEQVTFFSTFYDVMSSQPGILSSGDIQTLEITLQQQIDLFLDTFWTGKWQLWNGNNWTPHLCIAAMEWAIVFWHERNSAAREVIRAVNDIMWIHRDYYTEDGVYLEGIAMYAFMSIEGQMAMASLSRASFGFAPAALDSSTLQKTALFMLSSMGTDGYTIEFGDSHRKRGWDGPAVIEAAMSPLMFGENSSSCSMDSISNRAFSAALYGSGGTYQNPWRIRGDVLQFDALSNMRNPPDHTSKPLGDMRTETFVHGGYARMLTPLLSTTNSTPCFGNLCVDQTLPSLSDNIPYSSVSLQARPNTAAHSEVDFGTFIWSAWGSRLISEFGYGTIATSVTKWDMRRYLYLDNNPAGHSTIVIREAFSPDNEDINFSQLNHVAGSMSEESIGEHLCVLMDGSEVYGASRPDGWLDSLKRYVCNLSSGSNLILDVIQVKENRTEMSLFGSQYGGPDFNEPAPASQRLLIDEYFYTDTAAPINTTHDPPYEFEFDRNSVKWCSHVDPELLKNATSVALWPQCGIGGWRQGDGMGLIAGMSVDGLGHFEYDGLVTSVNRWLNQHALKQRRFRFVSDRSVGPEGDVRAFILAPSDASTPLVAPNVTLSDCASDYGCGLSDAPITCSCIQSCVGELLEWSVVLNGELRYVGAAGTCNSSSHSHDPVLVQGIKNSLQ